MEDRTTVVEVIIEPTHLFQIVQDWAQKKRFAVYERSQTKSIYSRKILLVKAWLSVEHNGTNARVEAWLAPKNSGPDFSGNAWKGWKVPVSSGALFGPVPSTESNSIVCCARYKPNLKG